MGVQLPDGNGLHNIAVRVCDKRFHDLSPEARASVVMIGLIVEQSALLRDAVTILDRIDDQTRTIANGVLYKS